MIYSKIIGRARRTAVLESSTLTILQIGKISDHRTHFSVQPDKGARKFEFGRTFGRKAKICTARKLVSDEGGIFRTNYP